MRKRRVISKNPLPQFDTLSRRYPQQIRRSPDDIGLKFISVAVRINNLPHHTNDLAATFFIKNFIKLAREVIKIDRIAVEGVCAQTKCGRAGPE